MKLMKNKHDTPPTPSTAYIPSILECVGNTPCPAPGIPRYPTSQRWIRTGDKPLSEPMLTRFTDAYMRHWVKMSLIKQQYLFLNSINAYIYKHHNTSVTLNWVTTN